MDQIAGLPFVKLKFDKDGDRVEPGKPVRPAGIRNLLVLAHGWKNDEAAADRLYSELVGNMLAAPGGQAMKDEGFGVTGIYWPAFVFKPDLTLLESDAPAPQGGAAAAGGGDLDANDLDAFVAEVAAFLEVSDPESFKDQARRATGGGGAADALADRLRQEVSAANADGDMLFEQQGRAIKGSDLFEFLKKKPALPSGSGQGGGPAAGGAAGGVGAAIGRTRRRLLAGPRAAVARMLNQFTYFEMKKRAGIVGAALAGQLDADGLNGVQLHLVGHSFGARLVTSTASRIAIRPRSLTLLQAAYSHNGLGIGNTKIPQGAFRNVVAQKQVSGPIVITHTHNDSAVGIAYVIASRASGTTASKFGGPTDPFGGMGANGAQLLKQGEAVDRVLTATGTPALAAGVITNVLADEPIKDHNDVANKVVARLVLAAVRV